MKNQHPAGLPVALVEPLTPAEEADFLLAITDAQARGEISAQEASELIDREYSLIGKQEA